MPEPRQWDNTLKGLMARRGYSYRELSRATGIPYPTLCKHFNRPWKITVEELQPVLGVLCRSKEEQEKVAAEILTTDYGLANGEAR